MNLNLIVNKISLPCDCSFLWSSLALVMWDNSWDKNSILEGVEKVEKQQFSFVFLAHNLDHRLLSSKIRKII